MDDETRETINELIDLIENEGLTITAMEAKEYIRGDPTDPEANSTGAEIDMKVYISHEVDIDEDNPYRVN